MDQAPESTAKTAKPKRWKLRNSVALVAVALFVSFWPLFRFPQPGSNIGEIPRWAVFRTEIDVPNEFKTVVRDDILSEKVLLRSGYFICGNTILGMFFASTLGSGYVVVSNEKGNIVRIERALTGLGSGGRRGSRRT